MQNRAWVVTGIFIGQVVCGHLVFAEDAEEANRRVCDTFSRVRKVRIENGGMKLVVEEITDFDQVFSLEVSYGKARWLAGRG